MARSIQIFQTAMAPVTASNRFHLGYGTTPYRVIGSQGQHVVVYADNYVVARREGSRWLSSLFNTWLDPMQSIVIDLKASGIA